MTYGVDKLKMGFFVCFFFTFKFNLILKVNVNEPQIKWGSEQRGFVLLVQFIYWLIEHLYFVIADKAHENSDT